MDVLLGHAGEHLAAKGVGGEDGFEDEEAEGRGRRRCGGEDGGEEVGEGGFGGGGGEVHEAEFGEEEGGDFRVQALELGRCCCC